MTLRGAAAIQAHGISSVEVKDAFSRAQSLLDDVPDHRLRGLLLHPLGTALYMRAELGEAEALAHRSEALSAATGDRTALLCACVTHGLVQHLRGRPRLARGWFEKALDAWTKLDQSDMQCAGGRRSGRHDPRAARTRPPAPRTGGGGPRTDGRGARAVRASCVRPPPGWRRSGCRRFSRCGSAMRRASRQSADELQALDEEFSLVHAPRGVSVVSRLGAGSRGRAARRPRAHPGRGTRSPCRSACGRGQAKRSAMRWKRWASPVNGPQRGRRSMKR